MKFHDEKIMHCEEDKEKYQKQIKQIENKYEEKVYKDYWWSGFDNFSKICNQVIEKDVSMERFYNKMHLIYKEACIAIHSSCIGNRTRLGSDFSGIDMGPWKLGHEEHLFLSTSSIINIIGVTYQYLDICNENVLNSLT